MVMPVLQKQSVDALAALTRMSGKRTRKYVLRPPGRVEEISSALLCYCARCVFLNPLDVAAPIWRWERLDQNLSACATHGEDFRTLSSGRILARRNFNQLLQLVSQQERKLRNEIL